MLSGFEKVFMMQENTELTVVCLIGYASACASIFFWSLNFRECFLGLEVHDYVPLEYTWVFINISIDFQPVCSCEVFTAFLFGFC